MIKYKLFKYPFFRYFTYNLLYSTIFCLIPIFFYLLIILSIVTSIDDTDVVNEIINYEITHFKEYETILAHINWISIVLIIFSTIFCITGYIFMVKMMLTKIFFLPYKNIILSSKIKSISWTNATLFSFANIMLSLCSSCCILYFEKFIQFNYTTIFYSLQIISFIVSWHFTYILLNKFIEYYTRIKLKSL